MPKKQKQKSFKALKAEWYARLKKDGFEDIENERGRIIDHGDHDDVRSRHLHFRSHRLYTANAEYYEWACELLFSDKLSQAMVRHGTLKNKENLVWELHCSGKTGKEIATLMKLGKRWTNEVIARIREAHRKAK